MIRLARPESPLEDDESVERARAAVQAHMRKTPEVEPGWRSKVWSRHRDTLLKAQHGKCSFCESMIARAQYTPPVEHFAPKRVYWWLAYTWENWGISCIACNTAKWTTFPLVNGAPAPSGPDQPYDPLLLDPFALVFDPAAHLGLMLDTRVEAWGTDDMPERICSASCLAARSLMGSTTIKVLDLNRDALRQARSTVAEQAMRLILLAMERDVRGDEPGFERARAELVELGGRDRAYAGTVRALVLLCFDLSWAEFAAAAE